jgi:hypothetical protein
MRETRLSETAVHDAVRAAIMLGELQLDFRKGPRRTNVYRLIKMTESVPSSHPSDSAGLSHLETEVQSSHPQDGAGAKSAPLGVRTSDSEGTKFAPELILNLSNEPTQKPKAPVLPDWLPLDPWNGFVEHRQKIKPLPTNRALDLILKKLKTLRDQGHDPAMLLDTAVERGWRSVFPPSGYSGNRPADLSERNHLAWERYKREHPEEKLQ